MSATYLWHKYVGIEIALKVFLRSKVVDYEIRYVKCNEQNSWIDKGMKLKVFTSKTIIACIN